MGDGVYCFMKLFPDNINYQPEKDDIYLREDFLQTKNDQQFPDEINYQPAKDDIYLREDVLQTKNDQQVNSKIYKKNAPQVAPNSEIAKNTDWLCNLNTIKCCPKLCG